MGEWGSRTFLLCYYFSDLCVMKKLIAKSHSHLFSCSPWIVGGKKKRNGSAALALAPKRPSFPLKVHLMLRGPPQICYSQSWHFSPPPHTHHGLGAPVPKGVEVVLYMFLVHTCDNGVLGDHCHVTRAVRSVQDRSVQKTNCLKLKHYTKSQTVFYFKSMPVGKRTWFKKKEKSFFVRS